MRILELIGVYAFVGSCVVWAQPTTPTYDFAKNGVQSAKVDNSTGVPRLLINGQPVPPLLFFYNTGGVSGLQYLAPQMQKAVAAGIHIYSFGLSNWPWDPGTAAKPADFSAADQEMDQLLKSDPQAVFLLRIPALPPPDWSGWANHDQWGKNEDNLYRDGTSALASIASDVYLQGFLAGVTLMIQHYESSSYAPRILGYHFTGQNTGEWFPENYREKGLDYSPANTTAFRSWLRQKYGTDQALSKAWGRPITLANAPIPTPAPGRFPIKGASQGDPVREFYSLPGEQDWVDYSDYISDEMSSRVTAIAHTVRTATAGKRLIAFFYGYIYDLAGSMNGHLRLDRILASPDIDIVSAPISYVTLQDRVAGGAGASMSARDSVALHGKLWMNEDDLFTNLCANLPNPNYNGNLPTADLFETYNVLLRNLASTMIHRGGTWWMDLNATGCFNDSSLWGVMSDYGLPLYNEVYSKPTVYRPEVAVITDERSVIYQYSDWDFMVNPRTLLRNAIAKTGASVGYYDLSDFISGVLPPAKVYIFVNAFYLTDDQIAAIRTRLQNEGATAIWQYAPGYLGPSGADIARSQALTGIQLAVAAGYSGSTGDSQLKNIVWGWAWHTPWEVLSPRLIVTDPNASVLGRYWSDSAVSTVFKRVNGFNSVFVGDVGWNTQMLTQLLSAAGVHIWTSGNDVIHTDGSYLVVHAGTAGQQNINLPAGVSASSLNGTVLATHPQPLQVTFSRVGETLWFRISQASQAAPAVQPWVGVVNGASFQGGLAAGGWVSVFGTNLSATSRTWGDGDFVNGKLPTQLDGVGVNVNGAPVPVYYISPTQINALLPSSLTGSTVSVEVVMPRGKSDAVIFPLSAVAPAFFVLDPGGRKYAAAVFAEGSYVGPAGLLGGGATTRPAKPGDILQLYATGLGQTSPQAPDGVIITTAYPLKTKPVVTVGGSPATVQFAGLVSAGLYQINIVVPQVADGDAALQVGVGTTSSPGGVFIAIAH